MATTVLVNNFWADKALYDDAERKYYENLAQGGGPAPQQKSSLASEVAKAREHIKTSLESIGSVGLSGKPAPAQIQTACKSGQCGASALAEALKAVQGQMQSLEKRVAALEIKCAGCVVTAPKAAAPPKPTTPAKKDDDDDVDLFGSDSEEDEEAEKLKEQRLAEYAAKKSKKPALIAKSSIILDVKPWDDETDMKQLEAAVRKIEMEGLLWGASKLVPLAYGIHKLQITCVVEDEKVSVDLLTEQIEAVEDLVQSVDIAAFNKI